MLRSYHKHETYEHLTLNTKMDHFSNHQQNCLVQDVRIFRICGGGGKKMERMKYIYERNKRATVVSVYFLHFFTKVK